MTKEEFEGYLGIDSLERYTKSSMILYSTCDAEIDENGDITFSPETLRVIDKKSEYNPVRTIEKRVEFDGVIDGVVYTVGPKGRNPRYSRSWSLVNGEIHEEMVSYGSRDRRIAQGMDARLAEFLSRVVTVYTKIEDEIKTVDETWVPDLNISFNDGNFTLSDSTKVGNDFLSGLNSSQLPDRLIKRMKVEQLFEGKKVEGLELVSSNLMTAVTGETTTGWGRTHEQDGYFSDYCDEVYVLYEVGDQNTWDFVWSAFILSKDGSWRTAEIKESMKTKSSLD